MKNNEILTPEKFKSEVIRLINENPSVLNIDVAGEEIEIKIGYSNNPELKGAEGKFFANGLLAVMESKVFTEYDKLYSKINMKIEKSV